MANYKYPASENAKGTHLREDLVKVNDTLEARIFQEVHRIIGDATGALVDIGAGEGRYSIYFGNNASDIIVIEPDAARLAKAKANLGSLKATVQGVEGGVLDAEIPSSSVDVVLNVHVLQHIHPNDAIDIIKKAAKWLKPGGMFVLCFTKKTSADSEYNVSWRDGEETGYGSISKSVFELLTQQPVAGALPVHKLDKEAVKSQLEEHDLQIIYEEDYTPRLIDTNQSRLGRIIIKGYKRMDPMMINRIQKFVGYKKFVDTCIVAQKT